MRYLFVFLVLCGFCFNSHAQVQSDDSLKNTIYNPNYKSTYDSVIVEPELIEDVTVMVSFVVEPTGKIHDVRAKKTTCKSCTREQKKIYESKAKKVITDMGGVNTPPFMTTEYMQPIRFKYSDDIDKEVEKETEKTEQ